MKLKYLFTAFIAAVAAMLASCSSEDEVTLMDELQISSSYVAIPAEGGSTSINITAADTWEITGAPAWLSIDKTAGEAGSHTINFSAEQTLDGRTAEVLLTLTNVQKVQHINIIQGLSTVSEATVAEVMAGPDSKSYQVKGTVTRISETATYGNFYMNDGTSSTDLYIYGTKFEGKTKQGALEKLGVEVGDEIIVLGPKSTYNGTVELVDVDVIKLNKSLIKVDSTSVAGNTLPKEGGEIAVVLQNKGMGIYVEIPDAAKSWLSISGLQGNTVVFNVAPNEAGARNTTVTFKTTDGKKEYSTEVAIAQEGSIQDVNCAQFNTLEDGTAQYKVHGIITSIVNDQYGNLYINDGTGEVYVYGVLDADGGTKNFGSLGLKVGDEVVLQSVKTSYKGAAQMKNAIVVESVAHEVKTVAELKELPDDKDTYFLVTGTVCHAEEEGTKFDLQTYGNFGLQDETGTIYVYGVADGLDGVTKNFAATGVQEGDKITILAYKTSYKGTVELVGKFIKKETAE